MSSAAPARAAGADAPDRGADREAVLFLYNQGKALLDNGKIAEACQKFEDAKHLDGAAINLLLRLGDCYERLGRTASAYEQFNEVAVIATVASDARAATARERASALALRLSRLSIRAPSPIAGLRIQINGARLASERLGAASPVDPGVYVIEASAPGKETWRTQRQVLSGALVEVVVPPLEALQKPKAEKAAAQPAPGSPMSGRALAIALGAVGIAGIGVGAAFGIDAMVKRDASNKSSHCDPNSFCDPTGYDLRKDAQRSGTISTITFAVGAAALAGGAILFFALPSRPRAAQGHGPGLRPVVAASIGPGLGALSLRGTF